MIDHEAIKKDLMEQAKRNGIPASEIRVLSTDPFFVGTDKNYTDAKWAAGLWDQMMSKRKKPLHLRGFHYWVQSQGIVKPNGIKYAQPNPKDSKEKQDKAPDNDWGYLLQSAQMARYLGIGEWKNLIDIKHPDPQDFDNYWVGSGLVKDGHVDIQTELNSKLEGLVDEFIQELLHESPKYSTDGYQTTHLEVWCEKNSMGFVIRPACDKYNACYQPLVGQSSVEKVNMAAERACKAIKAGKKARFFYIADFDRYGWGMVSAVARKLEFMLHQQGITDGDVKLTRLALNEEHIDRFKLPKAPKHGEEVVELDALEAIHPGELGKIVEEALAPYYDSEKPKKVDQENRRIREQVRQMLEDKLRQPLQEAFQDVDIASIAGDISLANAIDAKFEPPEPGHDVDDNNRMWVFDSKRSYWEQWKAYKTYKGSRVEEEVQDV